MAHSPQITPTDVSQTGISQTGLPKAVIFDLDGTLVTSSLDFAKMRRDIGCHPSQDILEFVAQLCPNKQEAAKAIIHEHEQQDAAMCELIQGVDRVLDHLAHAGIKTAIVTRNSETATALKLERSALSISPVITREHAPPKPRPDALLGLAQRWSLAPKHCVYVGDFRYDIEAAHNAGMHAGLYLPDSAPRSDLPDYADASDFCFGHYDVFMRTLSDYWRRTL